MINNMLSATVISLCLVSSAWAAPQKYDFKIDLINVCDTPQTYTYDSYIHDMYSPYAQPDPTQHQVMTVPPHKTRTMQIVGSYDDNIYGPDKLDKSFNGFINVGTNSNGFMFIINKGGISTLSAMIFGAFGPSGMQSYGSTFWFQPTCS